jgi:hypothetical protein
VAWRFLLFDSRSLEPQAELDCAGGVSYTEELNAPGSFQATMSLRQPLPITAEILEPPRAVFAVEKDDVIVGAWFVWAHDYDVGAGTVTLTGQGWLSYLHRRVLTISKHFAGWQQEDIAWNLIDYAQDDPNGDVGIVAAYQTWGVLRERHYYGYERKFIGELLEDLAAVRHGFDFRFVPRWAAGPNSTLEVAFTTVYPPLGRDTDLVFSDGAGGVTIPSVSLDGTSLAYRVDAIGRGEGDAIPIREAESTALQNAYLLLEDVVVHSDVEENDTLDDYAWWRLNRGLHPITIPKANLPLSLLGGVVVGDQVQVRLDRGLLQVDARYRITALDVELPADGAERLVASLAPLVAFQGE